MTTRREVLVALGALAAFPACSSSPSPAPDAGPRTDGGGGACDATTSSIALNHGHALTVSAADVVAGTARTYDIQGSAAHAHSVTLSPGDFTLLRTSGTVSVTSTAGGAHMHTVTVRCA